MKVIESKLKDKIIESYTTKIGHFHIFENLIIAEINEGEHISYSVLEDYFFIITKHFDDKPFAYISNRINSYSVAAVDFDLYCKVIKNFNFYAIVNYSKVSQAFLSVEERFCTTNFQVFSSLIKAYNHVDDFQSSKTDELVPKS